jgi:hypothetical protein
MLHLLNSSLQNLRYFLHLFGTHANAIQSLCSVLGLAAVCVYTYLTLKIRRTATDQMQASQRPLLVVDEDKKSKKWIIKNKGNGPALDIYWKTGSVNSTIGWTDIGALAVGDWSDLPNSHRAELQTIPGDGLRVHYEDLSGNSYCTLVRDSATVVKQDAFPLYRKDCLHSGSSTK